MRIQLRPIAMADIPAMAKVMAEAEAVDDTGEHYNEADLEEEFYNPDIDLEQDVVGAFDGDELVGYCSMMARKRQHRKIYVFGVTPPDRRGEGIGTLLAEAMLARRSSSSRLRRSDAGARQRPLDEPVPGGPVRGLRLQSRPLVVRDADDAGDVPPAPPLPDGYVVRVYQDGDSERARLAHNVAFLDHPNFSVWGQSEWKHWVTGSRYFRPALSFFVTPRASPTHRGLRPHQRVRRVPGGHGTSRGLRRQGGHPARPPRQGPRHAAAQHCLAGTRAGYDEASLDVDSMNPTGALGIYERAGFSLERRYANYARTLG